MLKNQLLKKKKKNYLPFKKIACNDIIQFRIYSDSRKCNSFISKCTCWKLIYDWCLTWLKWGARCIRYNILW
jgi:hypothetical protein